MTINVNVTVPANPAITLATAGVQGPAGVGVPATVVFVESAADLPMPVNGVITLANNVTYFIAGTIDLAGDRIVAGENTTIIGGSSENCRLKSTGLTGTALITSEYSLPMRNITVEADIALDLDATGNATAALDWFGVNFTDCASCGTIANYSNFIASDCGWLNSGALTFDGTIGTVGFAQCIFTPRTGATALAVAATATITRRFRVIYSAFVVTSGRTGINFSTSATVPDESYILDTANFSGGGTYTTGVASTSDKVRWVACVGVTNTVAIAQMYMKNNAVATDILVQNDKYKVAGTTEFAALSQRWTHDAANNAVVYASAVPRRVKAQVSFTIRGSANNVIGVFLAKCESGNSIVPDTDRLPESEVYVAMSGSRPDSAFVQAILDVTEGDRVYCIVQNTSSSADVTVEFLNIIVEQAVS